MTWQDHLQDVSRKVTESAKQKSKELWEHTRDRTRIHAKLEWRRTQHRLFRKLRDLYEPPLVPEWLSKKVERAGQDEVIEVPFKRELEPFLDVPLLYCRRIEISTGSLSGTVNGRKVRFILSQKLKDTLMEIHDPTLGIEFEEIRRQIESARSEDEAKGDSEV